MRIHCYLNESSSKMHLKVYMQWNDKMSLRGENFSSGSQLSAVNLSWKILSELWIFHKKIYHWKWRSQPVHVGKCSGTAATGTQWRFSRARSRHLSRGVPLPSCSSTTGVLSALELAPGCGVMPPGSAPVRILKAKTTMQTQIIRFLLWFKTVCRK